MSRRERNRTLSLGSASLEAKRRLDLQQIPTPIRPDDAFPDLPDDPTEVTDSVLMRVMTRLTKWAEYLSTQLAVAEVDERYAEASLDRIRALKSYDFRKPDAKTKAFEDPEFIAAQDAFEAAHAYRKMIGVTFANADRNSALLSRELTRRVGRDPRESRVARYDS